MLKYIEVFIMCLNAFALGVNMMKNSTVGMASSVVGLVCFILLFIREQIKIS